MGCGSVKITHLWDSLLSKEYSTKVVLPEYINLVIIPKNEFYFWSALYEIGFLDLGIEDIR